MLAAGIALVAARIWLGRGGALAAVARLPGHPRAHRARSSARCWARRSPHFPLYIVEALCRAGRLALPRDRPAALGALSRRCDRDGRPRRRMGLVARLDADALARIDVCPRRALLGRSPWRPAGLRRRLDRRGLDARPAAPALRRAAAVAGARRARA